MAHTAYPSLQHVLSNSRNRTDCLSVSAWHKLSSVHDPYFRPLPTRPQTPYVVPTFAAVAPFILRFYSKSSAVTQWVLAPPLAHKNFTPLDSYWTCLSTHSLELLIIMVCVSICARGPYNLLTCTAFLVSVSVCTATAYVWVVSATSTLLHIADIHQGACIACLCRQFHVIKLVSCQLPLAWRLAVPCGRGEVWLSCTLDNPPTLGVV